MGRNSTGRGSSHTREAVACIPKSQKARQTRGSAPSKTAFRRARYVAQDDAGEPGIGRRGIGMRGGAPAHIASAGEMQIGGT